MHVAALRLNFAMLLSSFLADLAPFLSTPILRSQQAVLVPLMLLRLMSMTTLPLPLPPRRKAPPTLPLPLALPLRWQAQQMLPMSRRHQLLPLRMPPHAPRSRGEERGATALSLCLICRRSTLGSLPRGGMLMVANWSLGDQPARSTTVTTACPV